MTCIDCGSQERTYTLKILTFPERTSLKGEKYTPTVPQIKESCSKCGRHIKFVKQDKYILDIFNEFLLKNPLKTQDGVLKKEGELL